MPNSHSITEESEQRPAALSEDKVGLHLIEKCPICESDRSRAAYTGVKDFFFKADSGSFQYNRCLDCRSLWLAEQPHGERLLQAYSSYYTHERGSQNIPKSMRNRVRSIAKRLYTGLRYGPLPQFLRTTVDAILDRAFATRLGADFHMRFAPRAPASVLDYGCGNGDYLQYLRPYKYRLTGLEYDPRALDFLKASGIAVEDLASIRDDRWCAEFDHITLGHVLEHVPDPKHVLQRLHSWLKSGGTIHIEVPNADATGVEIFGRYWRGLEAPRHFVLPTRDGLFKILEELGFGSIRQYVAVSNRGVMWSVSLEACPSDDREKYNLDIEKAPAETVLNAEFLTIVATKVSQQQ